MAQRWRITTINGLLLAAYFVPAWTINSFKIVVFPLRGIYERSNIGPVLYVQDTFHLSMLGTVRFAWLLVLAKFVVVAYFMIFAMITFRVRDAVSAAGDEALAFAILFGNIVSIGSMLAASYVGETAAVRLHATESLMLLGAFALLVIDSQTYGVRRSDAAESETAFVSKLAA